MSNTFAIDLEGLTPRQRELQLKFLACRRHKGECHCYISGQEPPITTCKKPKKLSRSWIKTRKTPKPVPTCNTCEVRENRCCSKKQTNN